MRGQQLDQFKNLKRFNQKEKVERESMEVKEIKTLLEEDKAKQLRKKQKELEDGEKFRKENDLRMEEKH